MVRKQNLTIIIPAYNEQNRIGNCIRSIERFKKFEMPNTNLIIVDDGSTDKTKDIINQFIDIYNYDWIELYSLDKNYGKGRAVRKGLWEAKTRLILILDCDLSVTPNEILNIPKLKSNTAILGKRIQRIKQPLYRIFLGKCWQILVYLKTGYYGDSQCPFKLFNVDPIIFGFLKVDGFAYDVELIKILKEANVTIYKYPVTYNNNLDTRVTIKKTIKMFFDLLKI